MKKVFQKLSKTEKIATIAVLTFVCLFLFVFSAWFTSLNGREWYDWIVAGTTPLVFLVMLNSLCTLTNL